MGVLAFFALAFCGVPPLLKALLMLTALVYLGNAARCLVRARWTHLVWHTEGHWHLYANTDAPHVAELVASTHVGWLLLLRFRLHGRKRFDAVLLPDNLDAETRRHLCVRLARGLPITQ